MHIVLGLIGILAAVGFWIYRINAAAQGARELADLAGEAANLPRKMRFRSKAKQRGLALVDDPREAAAILMLCTARCAGEVSVEQKRAIREQIERHFQLNDDQADELLARAAWVAGDLTDPENAISRMIDLIARQVSFAELQDLMSMLNSVALAEGTPRPEQEQFIKRCQLRAGLR